MGMDLVSFDTPGEFKMFEEIMARDNVTSIYTSGRKCNFQNKGCDGPHLQPINVNGWFWAGAGNGRIPPTNVPHPESAWSRTGETGIPQPDNYEGIKEGPIEAENNIGITIEGLQEFHDEADEGTNAIDVDSLPKLPELSSPAAPQTVPRQHQQFVQPPPQFAPQTQFAGQGRPPAGLPPRPLRPVPQRPPPQRPQPSRNPFTSIFSNFRLPFF